ncbi:von Willebrand factor type A [Trypanosoma grayi]|uniref:von Willebrand factor type A n=1 Tax=Trypanosoma grayi TaxID=71804 RepID=UPI0004F41257|nr:von Willebrand factor type A [Trypanosoma grayi]KEG15252.1 von Willebrand factor type A [Trypanosoma grayi]
MAIATPLLALLVLLLGAHLAEAQLQPECQAGKITLRNATAFITTSDIFGEVANVTFHFCSVAAEDSRCSSTGAGYVEVANETECVESFSVLVQPLTASGQQSTYFIVANANGTSTFRVNMQCNTSGTPGEVLYGGNISSGEEDGILWFEANFFSLDGCEVNNFFCETADDCVGTSCVNGVCIDTTCPVLSTLSQTVTVPSNYLSLVRVTDCYGFPVQGLLAENISVRLNGDSIDDPPLSFEVDNVRREAQQGGAVQITTLMIHQSRYVTSQYEDELKAALKALLQSLTAGQSADHYIALVVFDGSRVPITVQPHTTDIALLTSAVDGLPLLMPDPLSTNLYGAIVFGLEASYQMQSTFGGDTYTTLVICSDGYDTAARVTQKEAIQKAQYFAARNVTTLALGMSNASDIAFLRQVATSGYFEVSSTDALVASFERMALRIASLYQNVYYVLLCIPVRKGNLTITVSLNPPDVFQNVHPLEYQVNSDGFMGGCNESILNQTVSTGSNSSSPGSASVFLPSGGSINTRVDAYGGFFFHTNCTDEECVVNVTSDTYLRGNTLTVLVLVRSRCLLSPFCFDDSFNGTYAVRNNESENYQFMLISGMNIPTTFSIVSQASPHWTVPPPFLSNNQTGVRKMAGEADRSAIIIFSLTTVAILVAVFLCLFLHRKQTSGGPRGMGAPYKLPPGRTGSYVGHSSLTSLDLPALPHMEQLDEEGSYYHRLQ